MCCAILSIVVQLALVKYISRGSPVVPWNNIVALVVRRFSWKIMFINMILVLFKTVISPRKRLRIRIVDDVRDN